MSVLRKIPYIESKISALTSEQLATLKTVINSTGGADTLYTLETLRTYLTESKIFACQLEIGNKGAKSGFIIYNTTCQFLAYHQFETIQVYEITLSDLSIKEIKEDLTIEELRRIIGVLEAVSGGETEWESAIKTHLAYDSESEMVEGDDLSCDNVFANEELELGEEADFGTNAKAKIKEKIEESVPDATGHLNKVLTHNTTGNDWQYAQVPIYDINGNILGYEKIVECTQAEYDALTSTPSNTRYIIVESVQ